MAYFVNGNEIFREARKHRLRCRCLRHLNNLEWTRAELRAAEEN